MVSRSSISRWGGLAFVFGNVLFVVNKLDEMSRLFLSRPMPDVISGQNPGLILLGQVALIIGYVAYYQSYSQRVGRLGKYALRLFSGEEITAIFLFFRTLFALGLIGLGLTLWLEKPVRPDAV